MAVERWGSLSVDDHNDTGALVANVLLYDRLVLPVMTHQPDRDESAYWVSHGWNPDLQAKRLEQLADLAIRRPWNQQRRQAFKTRLAQLAAEQFDADHIDTFGMTRAILAGEQVTEKLPGVHHVQVIAAYNSTAAVQRDFQLADAADAPDSLSAQAFLLTRRLVVPDLPNAEDALRVAIELSRDTEFRTKRAALFDWQEAAIARGIPPHAAVAEIADMANAYNAHVAKACKKVRQKFAFTVCGIGLGFAGPAVAAVTAGVAAAATGGAIAVGAAALAVVRFAMHDSKPVIDAGSSRPAAMFHDVEAHVGIRLAPAG